MNTQHRQQGATLAVALILLLVSTILGVSAIQTTSMQEKMSSNTQDKVTSFEAAESALRAGEAWLLTLTTHPVPSTTCTSHPCVKIHSDGLFAETKTDSWWTSNSAAYAGTLGNVSSAPRYFVEFLRFVPDSISVGQASTTGVYYYQITSRGTGNTTNSVTILQSTFARRF
jgi:type IV pilus assembly protein PilX